MDQFGFVLKGHNVICGFSHVSSPDSCRNASSFQSTILCYRSNAPRKRTMGRIEKTVFISYRRTNFAWALSIYQDLTHHGYDVFFDVTNIPAGDFETVILENV